MRWRRATSLAALLAVGLGSGFGASVLAGREPAAGGAPSPVLAESPSIPVDPPPEYADDPGYPPLAVGPPMTTGRLVSDDARHEFPVPRGWAAVRNNSTTTKWRPVDAPPWSYGLRVEQVGTDNKTVARTLETRIEDLDLEEEDFEVLSETADTLTFSYTAENHLRVGMVRWLRPSGTPFAEVEVGIDGRVGDLPGMQALMAEIAAGMRAVQRGPAGA